MAAWAHWLFLLVCVCMAYTNTSVALAPVNGRRANNVVYTPPLVLFVSACTYSDHTRACVLYGWTLCQSTELGSYALMLNGVAACNGGRWQMLRAWHLPPRGRVGRTMYCINQTISALLKLRRICTLTSCNNGCKLPGCLVQFLCYLPQFIYFFLPFSFLCLILFPFVHLIKIYFNFEVLWFIHPFLGFLFI